MALVTIKEWASIVIISNRNPHTLDPECEPRAPATAVVTLKLLALQSRA